MCAKACHRKWKWKRTFQNGKHVLAPSSWELTETNARLMRFASMFLSNIEDQGMLMAWSIHLLDWENFRQFICLLFAS